MMNDNSDFQVELIDPATGEIEDITPGAKTPDDLYFDPDDSFDYNDASETWIGEPARTEIRITSIDGQVKRYLLREPDADSMDRIMVAMMNNDQHQFCKHAIEEPQLTHERWENRMTDREQKLLYDHIFAWLRFSEFITVQEQLAGDGDR